MKAVSDTETIHEQREKDKDDKKKTEVFEGDSSQDLLDTKRRID